MKDDLTFYACDTKILEEKIMTRDMVEGTELAGYLERLGTFLGTLSFDHVSLGEIFKELEKLTGSPFKFLLGMGARRLEPCGPITYCGRQIPSELGEFAFAIESMQKLEKKIDRTEKEQETLDKWHAFCEKIHIEKEPACLDSIKKFLLKYKDRTPELISAYTRW